MSIRRVVTCSDPLCEVTVMTRADGGAEAIVIGPKLSSTKIHIEPPDENERLVIKRMPDGCVDIYYEDIPA